MYFYKFINVFHSLWCIFSHYYQISLYGRNYQISPIIQPSSVKSDWNLGFPPFTGGILCKSDSRVSARGTGLHSIHLSSWLHLSEAALACLWTEVKSYAKLPFLSFTLTSILLNQGLREKTKWWHNIISHSGCLSSVFLRKWLLS